MCGQELEEGQNLSGTLSYQGSEAKPREIPRCIGIPWTSSTERSGLLISKSKLHGRSTYQHADTQGHANATKGSNAPSFSAAS